MPHLQQKSQNTESETRNSGEHERRHPEVPEQGVPTHQCKKKNTKVNGWNNEVKHTNHSANGAKQTCTRPIASDLTPSKGGGRGVYKTVNGDVPFSVTNSRLVPTDTTTMQSSQPNSTRRRRPDNTTQAAHQKQCRRPNDESV